MGNANVLIHHRASSHSANQNSAVYAIWDGLFSYNVDIAQPQASHRQEKAVDLLLVIVLLNR
jgi:hypothetical protein